MKICSVKKAALPPLPTLVIQPSSSAHSPYSFKGFSKSLALAVNIILFIIGEKKTFLEKKLNVKSLSLWRDNAFVYF